MYVKCPTCGRPVEWSEANTERPFCSHRCRLIDLGDWAAERHAIPGEPTFDNEEGDYPSPPEDDRYH